MGQLEENLAALVSSYMYLDHPSEAEIQRIRDLPVALNAWVSGSFCDVPGIPLPTRHWGGVV